jgi:hypothetical protein
MVGFFIMSLERLWGKQIFWDSQNFLLFKGNA